MSAVHKKTKAKRALKFVKVNADSSKNFKMQKEVEILTSLVFI
jgi:hypothetical protein